VSFQKHLRFQLRVGCFESKLKIAILLIFPILLPSRSRVGLESKRHVGLIAPFCAVVHRLRPTSLP